MGRVCVSVVGHSLPLLAIRGQPLATGWPTLAGHGRPWCVCDARWPLLSDSLPSRQHT